MMLRLKMFVALMVLAISVPGVVTVVVGQGKAEDKKVPAVKAKELPKEISIPEARTDKVLLFQEQTRTVQLEQQAAIEKFKAGEEWKSLEARQKFVGEKLVAELSSALKLAGVEEKDFYKYTYDKETLKFVRKEEAPKK
jgi:hypothetical protein